MTKSVKTTRARGEAMETFACNILCQQGLTLMAKNYHTRLGEIDLIMREQTTLVFVEVRYRRNIDHGGALESICGSKISKITRTAHHYLQRHGLIDKVPVRFDVFAISGESALQWNWIQSAFESN